MQLEINIHYSHCLNINYSAVTKLCVKIIWSLYITKTSIVILNYVFTFWRVL
nr:MAG TPA: hypothetical protein [Caudoviricetes sp.]